MDAREQRGMEIAATQRLRRSKAGWVVPSQSDATISYMVASDVPGFKGLSCDCPDFDLRGLPCKHIFAVEYVMRREAPDGTVVTEAVRVTYTQDWASYNAAQCAERKPSFRCWLTFAPLSPTPHKARVAHVCP